MSSPKEILIGMDRDINKTRAEIATQKRMLEGLISARKVFASTMGISADIPEGNAITITKAPAGKSGRVHGNTGRKGHSKGGRAKDPTSLRAFCEEVLKECTPQGGVTVTGLTARVTARRSKIGKPAASESSVMSQLYEFKKAGMAYPQTSSTGFAVDAKWVWRLDMKSLVEKFSKEKTNG